MGELFNPILHSKPMEYKPKMKTCKKCQEEKPVTKFYYHPGKGYFGHCKQCILQK